MLRKSFQPVPDHCQLNRGLEVHRQFVETRGTPTVLLNPVDAPFHGVTPPVGHGVEGRGSATGRPPAPTVGDLVLRLGDRGPDSSRPEILSVGTRRLRLVRQHPLRASPRPATARDGYPDFLDHRHHLRTVTCLTWGDDKRHHPAVRVDAHVDLR